LKIDSYNLGMESARLYKSSTSTRKYVESNESELMWTGSQLSSFENLMNGEEQSLYDSDPSDMETVLEKAMKDLSSRNAYLFDTVNENTGNISTLGQSNSIYSARNLQSEFQKLHQLMIKYIYELLFGERKTNESYRDEAQTSSEEMNPGYNAPGGSFYVRTDTLYSVSSFSEYEATSFSTFGTVKTEDGREINVNINVSMSRSFSKTFSSEISSLSFAVHDPLVINLKDAPASLSDVSFFFDIDMDGENEEISKLNSGSGFLALDKNEDGIINNGSELFGPDSGNGFKDLSAYDSDNNGWIDENDEIFTKLKIWTKDIDGNDVLYSLKDQNVGAIYLGSSQTDFSLNSTISNETRGYVRETGIFLYEDGNAGTIQHIDLVS